MYKFQFTYISPLMLSDFAVCGYEVRGRSGCAGRGVSRGQRRHLSNAGALQPPRDILPHTRRKELLENFRYGFLIDLFIVLD